MPRFTSLHRPTGSHFLDFSPCRCDDSSYDEAYGPNAPSKYCCEDKGVDENDIEIEEDKFNHDPGLFRRSLARGNTQMITIEEWIWSRYSFYMLEDLTPGYYSYMLEDATSQHLGGMQYGSGKKDPSRYHGRMSRKWGTDLSE